MFNRRHFIVFVLDLNFRFGGVFERPAAKCKAILGSIDRINRICFDIISYLLFVLNGLKKKQPNKQIAIQVTQGCVFPSEGSTRTWRRSLTTNASCGYLVTTPWRTRRAINLSMLFHAAL